MGFRPGHIRAPWCGLDTGASVGTAIEWQHSFFPQTLRSDATLTDRIYANIIRANLDQSGAVSKYYICQGFFHPQYDSGAVSARISFTSLNTTSISTISFNGAFRAWDENDPINATISPGAVQTVSVAVNAAELLYTQDIALQDYGNHVPGNAFEARVNWTAKGSATEMNIVAMTLTYKLTKQYV
jgi:hypothetical protein